MDSVIERLGRSRIVPVLTLKDEDVAEPLARALLSGGIDVVEITYRTEAATQVIAHLRRALPQLLVLAGTIIELGQLAAAVSAGAQAVISPALNPTIIDAARAAQVVIIPGVATASEADRARSLGISLVKIFPVTQLGGAAYLSALHAVYPELQFVPTGGIGFDDLRSYAPLDYVCACGLGSVAPPELIDAGHFDEIAERARRAREMMQRFT